MCFRLVNVWTQFDRIRKMERKEKRGTNEENEVSLVYHHCSKLLSLSKVLPERRQWMKRRSEMFPQISAPSVERKWSGGSRKNERKKEKLFPTGRCENKRAAVASSSSSSISSSSSGFELQWRSVVAELCLARRAADRLMEIGGVVGEE